MSNEVNKKVDAHGICGRPQGEALKIKDRVRNLLNLVSDMTLVACWDIIDQTMARFQTCLRNNQCWSPAVSFDEKVYLVNESLAADNPRIDRWRFALHDDLVSIDITLSISGESCIATNEIAAYAKLKLAKCFHSRARGFDMPIMLTIAGHDGSELFEFRYDPEDSKNDDTESLQ
ncbi:hypothetical protein DST30_22980 [Salmonella enterica subsp. enterica serovar Panama]|nr:hypothetical protein [Salmonella enterica subsp. enterica serovar Panama]